MSTATATSLMEKEINGELLTQDLLVKRHKRLVHRVCNKYKHLAEKVGLGYEDIVSIGFIGLLKAFRYFDGEKYDVRFSTYAIPMIRGEILRELRDQHPGLKYSRPIKDIATHIQKAELQESSIDEIAIKLDVCRDKVIHALNFIFHQAPRSMDKKFKDVAGHDATLHLVIGSEDDTTSLSVWEFIKTLSPREQIVCSGLMEGLLQVEIGEIIGVTQVQTSRVIKKIRSKYLEFKEIE